MTHVGHTSQHDANYRPGNVAQQEKRKDHMHIVKESVVKVVKKRKANG